MNLFGVGLISRQCLRPPCNDSHDQKLSYTAMGPADPAYCDANLILMARATLYYNVSESLLLQYIFNEATDG